MNWLMKFGFQMRARLGQELREYFVLSSYLWITFGSLELLKWSILQAHHIAFYPYGFAAIKALVCAKFILVGRMVGVGRTREGERLMVSIARRSVALLILLIGLSVIEEVAVALIHDRSIEGSIDSLGGGTHFQMAATILVLLLILIPYVSFQAIGEALGEGELRRLLLGRPGKGDSR